jgi:hypothetical protein
MPYHKAPAILQPHFEPRVSRCVGRGLRHLHFDESRRRVFPRPFLPPIEMRAPKFRFRQNAATLSRLCIWPELLYDDFLPQDAIHVALSPYSILKEQLQRKLQAARRRSG